MATLDGLIKEREELALAVEMADDGGFPGSKAWLRHSAALKALAAFDGAHPEVLSAMRGPLSEGAARALRGED